ncbi:16S rRNA (cytidine1402-2'-O)-methyltransferase [Microbacterium halimionae]|uniref:Ribosomal RNA small subunit methyltransferase I n=1 Tax=Microbacterium halimionae TaxID=1526413 RepID=A0A7W3JMU5_9MICO|nr:16S rRNA (cytidine(1402)-2'-O)-methyltransferase [Microbacterium halimionae]MBA8815770.1 16S rRNA (cytidine1402-2'-O)-methyltransferase [Microbacterium halimionae]NII95816.1 16S rRNA (cytidine1402-2'-O)-methyltransferase [Microbacterium halimionae]
MIILAATPIGNLGDVTRRLVEALENATVVAAEDTRTTQRLLAGLGITNRPRLIAVHDHNEKERAAEIIALAETDDVLVISDAGMPTVSDPGYGLVSAAIAAGVTVTALPGPSAVLTALAVAGLPTDRFTFEGFLPRKPAERRAQLVALSSETRTMVFFESPARTGAALVDMAAAFGDDRQGAVCRELTKFYEEVVRGPVAELAKWAEDGVRGEVVLVVGGSHEEPVSFPAAVAQVTELVAAGGRLKEAVREVAGHTGHSSRDLYQAALGAKGPGAKAPGNKDSA